jgi:hypothetical protein
MKHEPAGPVLPEEWPVVFTHRLVVGDVEGIAALYDSDARFVTPSGDTLVGRDRIRAVLAAGRVSNHLCLRRGAHSAGEGRDADACTVCSTRKVIALQTSNMSISARSDRTAQISARNSFPC